MLEAKAVEGENDKFRAANAVIQARRQHNNEKNKRKRDKAERHQEGRKQSNEEQGFGRLSFDS